MCLRIYILSDKPLPERLGVRGCAVAPTTPFAAWLAAYPAFRFAAEFLVGGCGCALIPTLAHGGRAGLRAAPSPHQLLGEVLSRLMADRRSVQLLTVWAGGEPIAPKHGPDVAVDAILEGRLPLAECIDGPPLRFKVVPNTQTRPLRESGGGSG